MTPWNVHGGRHTGSRGTGSGLCPGTVNGSREEGSPASFQRCVSSCDLLLTGALDLPTPELMSLPSSSGHCPRQSAGKRQAPAGEPLTWAGSICLVLYRERHIFRTSSPSASLLSDVHLASIAAASLTQGLSVTLALREKRQGPGND